MNRLKDLLYTLTGWFAKIGLRKASAKRVLIVRVDEIGDFMLWRPFIQEIVSTEKFRGYEFHFCGNQSWKTLFDTFDASAFSKTFWVDKIKFKKNLQYRYRFLRGIHQQQYDVVINPTFSRDKRYDDSIVFAANAKENIGMASNLESTRAYEYGYDRNLYTSLFDHPERPLFEFIRNRLFAEFVTGKKSTVNNTQVNPSLLPSIENDLPENYFVVFPGSRSAARIWPTENFILVSNYLFENFGWTAIVAGTKADKKYTEHFCSNYKNPVVDLTGKTSLTQMLTLLSKAKCLLSVDTGSVHLAAAVGCTVFGIFNGSQYKRFAPYPAEVAANIFPVYPDDVEKELNDPAIVRSKYEFVVNVPYASVKPEKVILCIHEQV